MGTRRDDLRRFLAALLAGALLVVAAVVVLVLDRAGLPDAYAFLAPAVLLAAPLVLALAARLEPQPARPPAGDLDHLLALKRTDGLPPARRPPVRWDRLRPDPASVREPEAAEAAAPLDRLVRRKREWAEAGAAGRGVAYPGGPPDTGGGIG